MGKKGLFCYFRDSNICISLQLLHIMDIKKLRYDLRLSQADLAKLFECNQSHISNIENGSRNLTKLQLRLLIEKYGVETIAKYADETERPSVIINAPNQKIEGNSGPVNAGDGTQTNNTADATLLDVMKQQSAQITTLLDQQERLITLLEQMNNKQH